MLSYCHKSKNDQSRLHQNSYLVLISGIARKKAVKRDNSNKHSHNNMIYKIFFILSYNLILALCVTILTNIVVACQFCYEFNSLTKNKKSCVGNILNTFISMGF